MTLFPLKLCGSYYEDKISWYAISIKYLILIYRVKRVHGNPIQLSTQACNIRIL